MNNILRAYGILLILLGMAMPQIDHDPSRWIFAVSGIVLCLITERRRV